MNIFLKITIRVISRRISEGEQLDTILLDYPKLTAEEISQIKTEIGE